MARIVRRLPWWIALVAFPLLTACRDSGDDGAETDDFPRKAVKVIVPFSAGGGSDTFTRIMQQGIRDANLLPQPLVVINVPGAGGTVGSRRVRDAKADGYTILNLHEGIFCAKYSGRVPFGAEAFRPIAATGQSVLVVCVREDSPHRSLPDLLRAASEAPDEVLFGMAPGTPTHFTARKLELAAKGARFRLVASGGGSKRFNDLSGGHIDATPFSLAEYAKFSAGGIRALAVLADDRHPDFPDLPTARESGVEVVMTHIDYWWAPKSTPDEAVERLADALGAALATDGVRARLAELKIDPLFLRGAELEAHLQAREADFQGATLVPYESLPDPVLAVLVLVAVLAALTIMASRRNRAPQNYASHTHWRYLLLTFSALALYVLAMQLAGLPYALATIAFVPVLGFAAGARKPRQLLILTGVAAVVATGCFFLFTEVLVIDLP